MRVESASTTPMMLWRGSPGSTCAAPGAVGVRADEDRCAVGADNFAYAAVRSDRLSGGHRVSLSFLNERRAVSDLLIDAAMARSVHADAARSHVLFACHHDSPRYPSRFVARFATDHPTIYTMVADSLAEIQAMLPPDLAQSSPPAGLRFYRCPVRGRRR